MMIGAAHSHRTDRLQSAEDITHLFPHTECRAHAKKKENKNYHLSH